MRRVVMLCLAAMAFAPRPAASAPDDATALEQRVKAAFLYKFAGYVEWPETAFASADMPVTIGVIGDDALASELVQLAMGRTVDGRPVSVRRLTAADALSGLHILFVASAERAHLAQFARSLQAQPALVVSESDGALNQGSTINFVISNGRVRFEISLDNAEKQGIRLSSRLLTVALSVRMGAPL